MNGIKWAQLFNLRDDAMDYKFFLKLSLLQIFIISKNFIALQVSENGLVFLFTDSLFR